MTWIEFFDEEGRTRTMRLIRIDPTTKITKTKSNITWAKTGGRLTPAGHYTEQTKTRGFVVVQPARLGADGRPKTWRLVRKVTKRDPTSNAPIETREVRENLKPIRVPFPRVVGAYSRDHHKMISLTDLLKKKGLEASVEKPNRDSRKSTARSRRPRSPGKDNG